MARDDDSKPKRDLVERVDHAYFMRIANPARSVVMFGRFEGVREIGRGSFGIIFLVRDLRLDREVALKLCKVANDEHRGRFVREAQILAKLSHPNIITIHDVGCFASDAEDDEHDGAPFMVMELAEGGSGKDLIARRPRWEDCVDFYLGAGRGLAAAHVAGVVHGDFKPSNIIRGSHGALVADFGLAHTLGSADQHNGGTPGYLAPELIEGGGNSPLADQWSFCVSLWETLEGVRPFEGKNPMSLLQSIEAGEPNVGRSSMPPRLRLALLRGLALEATERWPSMEALVAELEAIRAQPSEPDPKARARLPGGVLVSTVLGGLIAGFVVAQLIGDPREQPGSEAVNEAVELVEPSQAREEDVEVNGETACALEKHPFHVPSAELEEVCQMIRAGRIADGETQWRKVREQRAPTQGDERFKSKIMNIATETQIVMDTCDDYVLGASSEAKANEAGDCSSRMSSLYDLDMTQIGPSP